MHSRVSKIGVDDDDLLAGKGERDGEVAQGERLALRRVAAGDQQGLRADIDTRPVEIAAQGAQRFRDTPFRLGQDDERHIAQDAACETRQAAEHGEAEDLAGLNVGPDTRVEMADDERQDDAHAETDAEAHDG